MRLASIALVFALAGLLLAVLFFAVRDFSVGLSEETTEYDKDRYDQIREAIHQAPGARRGDPQHLRGKLLDELTKELSLDGIPWDDISFQEPVGGSTRLYHFRGFALCVCLTRDDGVLRLDDRSTFVKIDGVADGKERMRRIREGRAEECEHFNARIREMQKGRR